MAVTPMAPLVSSTPVIPRLLPELTSQIHLRLRSGQIQNLMEKTRSMLNPTEKAMPMTLMENLQPSVRTRGNAHKVPSDADSLKRRL